jgi:hypothetical protein
VEKNKDWSIGVMEKNKDWSNGVMEKNKDWSNGVLEKNKDWSNGVMECWFKSGNRSNFYSFTFGNTRSKHG